MMEGFVACSARWMFKVFHLYLVGVGVGEVAKGTLTA